ncbi:MAG: DegT/DnrJ/EryC1/StrS family aminotransferase [Ignavibacteria bacterium]|nr:DegT/DnrJ/EryC1/StrS family aminotransferase [Ignavibacteria bacterium]
MENNFTQFHRPFINDEEINEVVATLKSGWLSMGPRTIQFEDDFRNYIGADYSVSVNSWTAGGHLSLEAFGLKPGDEVIVPTMTFPATAEIVYYFGAKPVIVDVDKDTLNLSISEIEKAITKKTKVIIPVHYAGQPADLDEINQIAKAYNLKVIEDAAHSLPSYYKGKKIGSISDVTVFSFYATKTLCTGEGGMICSNNEEFSERTRLMRMHGMNRDAWKRYSDACSWYYEIVAPGFKYNFTDLQAALGIVQLRKVDQMLEMRKHIASLYTKELCGNEFISLPVIKSDRETSWHLYPIRLNLEALKIGRNDFINELKDLGVGTGVHFMPVHQHQFYKDSLSLNNSDFPVANDAFERLISIPIYPGLTDAEVTKVIEAVNHLTKKHSR